jgi:signal transduction histidine kinase
LDGTTGQVLAKVALGSVCRGLRAWRDDAAGAGAIVCVLDDGRCVRYRYAGGALAVDREARLSAPAGTVFAADFLPEPGPEFLISAVDGSMRLLGADLALLARLPDWSAPSPGAGIWDLGRESVMLYASRSGLGYQLVATPLHRRYAGPAGAGIVLLGAGVLGGTLVRQRRRLGRLRHTSRRDLLHAFLTSSHGTIGPVAALERALWSLENAAPMAAGAPPPLDVWERCRREAVPELETLLEKADQVRIDPPLQSIVRRELGNVGRIFDELAAGDVRAERRPGLIVAGRVSLGLVADGMKSLGATLAASCVLDPAPLVRELLARHSARNPAVVFVLHEDPEAPVRACHADAADLAFIVDNLLDNAVRQVSGAAAPAVTAVLRADSGRVYLSVTDNGPGVPAADRERIFAAGVSTRDGGGLGLWHSREAVRYYGGDLTVAEAPGGGASFLLSLRAAMA